MTRDSQHERKSYDAHWPDNRSVMPQMKNCRNRLFAHQPTAWINTAGTTVTTNVMLVRHFLGSFVQISLEHADEVLVEFDVHGTGIWF